MATEKSRCAKVIVGAADTFRAAAIEQLRVWTDRAGIPLVAREQGADAAGIAYDTAERAKRDGMDIAIIDTAGRLQNREELMSELNKIVRAIRKVDEDAPHETLLVLDATVGQNALSQMEAFRSATPLSGIVMTKLDGTAKGGVLVAIVVLVILAIGAYFLFFNRPAGTPAGSTVTIETPVVPVPAAPAPAAPAAPASN